MIYRIFLAHMVHRCTLKLFLNLDRPLENCVNPYNIPRTYSNSISPLTQSDDDVAFFADISCLFRTLFKFPIHQISSYHRVLCMYVRVFLFFNTLMTIFHRKHLTLLSLSHP